MKKELIFVLIFVLGGLVGIAARSYTQKATVEFFEDFGAKTSARQVGGCMVLTTLFPNDPSPRFFIDCGKK